MNIDEIRHVIKGICMDFTRLWIRLISEKNFKLIKKLYRAEKHEPGFCSIVVSKDGFSESDTTHNLVLKFLRYNKINIVNPNLEDARINAFLNKE